MGQLPLPSPYPPSAVLFISQAAPFPRRCTIFLFPRLFSSLLFSGSSHVNFGVFGVFSPLSIAPWSISSAWVGGWQLRHPAGPDTGSASTSAGYLLPRAANDPGWCLSPDLPHGIKITCYLLCLTCLGHQTPTLQ